MQAIKESYGHLKSFKQPGEVERSQFKIKKNPHQEILDKLINRPFLKHKVMTSVLNSAVMKFFSAVSFSFRLPQIITR